MSEPMDDLIRKLEEATGPSRELDREIGLKVCGWRVREDGMLDVPGEGIFPDSPGSMYPAFTELFDTAMTLVPERLSWAIKSPGFQSMSTSYRAELESGDYCWEAEASTPALALCIAALKSLSASPDKG